MAIPQKTNRVGWLFDKIDSLEAELEAANQRIAELQSSDHLTAALTKASAGNLLVGQVRNVLNQPTTSREDVQSALMLAVQAYDREVKT